MLTSATRRFVLPFSNDKTPLEVEHAAVYTVADSARGKGGGFLSRQTPERITSISKLGYPLWVIPKNSHAYIFNGLGNSTMSFPYTETPSASDFLVSIEKQIRPREKYSAFLVDYSGYFLKHTSEKRFTIEGLVAEAEFKSEFQAYRRESTEFSGVGLALVPHSLDEVTVSNSLTGVANLLSGLKAENERLQDCLRLVKKTTSEYLTELDYEASAAAEEANAKIKAQQEIVNPQVAQLNKDYSKKIKETKESFDGELEQVEKLREKTEKFIQRSTQEIKDCLREAKAHEAKGHRVWAKQWREKAKKAQRELDGLNRELRKLIDDSKRISSQRSRVISELTLELDREVKLARQPLLELEAQREHKISLIKQEAQKLLAQEKPLIETINRTLQRRENIGAEFEATSINEITIKTPALFYLPFYFVVYESGLSKRYLIIAPSNLGTPDFSAKLKGALGMSKVNNLLIPRFQALGALVTGVQTYAKQNPVFESQLLDLAERTNLLNTTIFNDNVKRGLTVFNLQGWLSERELSDSYKRLTA